MKLSFKQSISHIQKNSTIFLESLWNKIALKQPLSLPEKLIFFLLLGAEKCYQIIFFFVNRCKQRNAFQASHFKVISVGNLSVGGTGKSVLIPFLVRLLEPKQGAIFMRGYKSVVEKTKSNLVISREFSLPDVSLCGDEAYMLASSLPVPICVGSNRVKSVEKLEEFCITHEKVIDYLLLDDAYQNHQLKKNVEILLVDARKPLENGYCLPAGRLREKDYSRADVLILTHADLVTQQELEHIKKHVFSHFDQDHIFTGRHNAESLLLNNQGADQSAELKNKKVLLLAGIGSFSNFYASVSKLGLVIQVQHEYEDHHCYSSADFEAILYDLNKNDLSAVITTAKDWYKLEPILRNHKRFNSHNFYVLRIEFEFLSAREYSLFKELMLRRLE